MESGAFATGVDRRVSPTAITFFRHPLQHSQIDKKRALFTKTHDALAPGGSFIIYQITNG